VIKKKGQRVGRWFASSLAGLFVALDLLAAVPGTAAEPEVGQHVEIPIFLDKEELGVIDTAFAANGIDLDSVDASAVLIFLHPVLLPDVFMQIEMLSSADGRLSPAAFGEAGLGLEFDAAQLTLRLVVPANVRRGVDLRLGASDGYHANRMPPELPAAVSGYLNLRAAGDHIVSSVGSEWQPAILDFDGAVNVLGNVLEGTATKRGGGAWSRGDVRFIHDFVSHRTRLAAGDVGASLAGFQTFQRAGGISFGRAFNLQPYRSSAPTGQTTLLIERQSRVDVLVNGLRVGTLNLGPGQYNVRDFPFAAGTNDVSLRVVDEVGRTQDIDFPFVFDSSVLAAKEQDYQYMIGFAAMSTPSGRSYDTKEPVASLTHSLGLTDQLTIGVNAQGSRHQQMAGLQGRAATKAGAFRLDVAGSRIEDGTSGYAVQLQYRYVDTIGERTHGRSAEIVAGYRSRRFAGLGVLAPDNPVALDVGVRYGQRILGDVFGSVGGSWQNGRAGSPNAYTADLSVSKSIFRDVNAYLSASRSKRLSGRVENRIFLSLLWYPRSSGHSISSSYDSRARAATVGWHHSPMRTVNVIETDVAVTRSPESHGIRAEANYTGYRFDARVFQTADFGRGPDNGNSYRTSINAGTALAFADGHFGVSRPISDSFALIAPHRLLRGHTVEVNGAGQTPEAKTDLFGPAVLPELTSYYRYQVVLNADLPEGLDLGRDFFTLEPNYRSGTVVAAGSGASVLLEMSLVDFAGQPLYLELGKITQEALPPVDFFTDQEGRLRVIGLRPGKATLELANYPEAPLVLEIPPDAVGRYDAGTATLPIAALPAEVGK
jgi:outer membrane usher protein